MWWREQICTRIWNRKIQSEAIAGRGNHGALDDVFQFPDISGPLLLPEDGNLALSHPQWLTTKLDAKFPQEMISKRCYVVDTLTQWRYLHRKDAEAVEQVFSKSPGLDLVEQIPIGRCDDAHIHLDRLVISYSLKFALLKCAQQFSLLR